MTYDLAVWAGPPPATDADAAAEYSIRSRAMRSADAHGGASASPVIQSFVAAALDRFPALGDSHPESPWAGPDLLGSAVDDFLYLELTYSGAIAARDELAAIALSLGLVCFDPQIEQVLPSATAPSAASVARPIAELLGAYRDAPPSSQPRSWVRRLLAGRTAAPRTPRHH